MQWAVATAWRHGRPEAWLGMSGLKSDAEMSIVSVFVCVSGTISMSLYSLSLDSLFLHISSLQK